MPNPLRCAIYTRKSTEDGLDQAFNSLDAQREACGAYILSQAGEGWTASPDHYDDGGISGGTMARPALQRLLAEVEAGRIQHTATEGVELRDAAKRFAAHREDMLDWIDGLATPRVPERQKRQERERLKRAGKKATEWAQHRVHHLGHLPEMWAGDVGMLVVSAQSYLKLFHDMGEVEAHLRVAEWLGPDVADAAHAGFEAFIGIRPPLPSAAQIAEAVAKGEAWDARHIIIAALAERLRLGKGFADLTA